MGALGFHRTIATKDAFETKKYLKKMEENERRFNLFISTDSSTFNLLDITENQLYKVVAATQKVKVILH
ncbi:MAG: hypothetical protein IPP25_00065 [Saprospiraceae bacterium]|nr:hypothetical protein [Candidatus Opimibacter skivensis]